MKTQKEAVLCIQKELGISNVFTHLNILAITLLSLYNEGLLDNFMNDTQNDSPTIREFIELANDYEEAFFICYVVNTDREDTRITIEGFNLECSKDTAIKLMSKFRNADEVDYTGNNLRIWWD